MDTQTHLNVFAYGSNLHERRMRKRVSTAEAVTIGFVEHRELKFHKRSTDGSAKADAAFSVASSDRVWGVVYRMSRVQKIVLDNYESLGIGYDEQQVSVRTGQGAIQAWMYFARREAIDESLKPYSWYFDYVIAGARNHRLPFCYIGKLLSTETILDPDASRHEQNRQLIESC